MKSNPKVTRRNFLATAGGTMVSIGLPGVFVKLMDSENQALAAETRADGRARIPPGQHAVRALVPMGGIDGPGDIASWNLQVSGEVDNPLNLNLKDLKKLNQVNLTCDVHCVTGWTLLDSKWRGIQVKAIMDIAKVKQSARFVIFEAHAGYTSNIPISEAGKKNVILAHRFFGNKLPRAHGAPMRALVPDRYFYKSAKWLKGIRFSAVDEPGYYERRGWSNTADPWREERVD